MAILLDNLPVQLMFSITRILLIEFATTTARM